MKFTESQQKTMADLNNVLNNANVPLDSDFLGRILVLILHFKNRTDAYEKTFEEIVKWRESREVKSALSMAWVQGNDPGEAFSLSADIVWSKVKRAARGE